MGANGNAAGAASGASFTLNAGTIQLLANGTNTFGGANSTLYINGGNISNTATGGTRSNLIVIGGDIAFQGSGGVNTWSGTVSITGNVPRKITLDSATSGQVFSGVISSTATNGLTFDATATGVPAASAQSISISNIANTFTGPITINNGEVVFANSNSLGNSANDIVIGAGRLTMTTGDIASTHGLSLIHI